MWSASAPWGAVLFIQCRQITFSVIYRLILHCIKCDIGVGNRAVYMTHSHIHSFSHSLALSQLALMPSSGGQWALQCQGRTKLGLLMNRTGVEISCTPVQWSHNEVLTQHSSVSRKTRQPNIRLVLSVYDYFIKCTHVVLSVHSASANP